MIARARLHSLVIGQDLTDADELLGQTEMRLMEGRGSHSDLTIHGAPRCDAESPFADCRLSFSYEIIDRITSKPAVLTLSSVRLLDELAAYKKKGGGKKGSGATGKDGGEGAARGGPFLKFTLLEVGCLRIDRVANEPQ